VVGVSVSMLCVCERQSRLFEFLSVCFCAVVTRPWSHSPVPYHHAATQMKVPLEDASKYLGVGGPDNLANLQVCVCVCVCVTVCVPMTITIHCMGGQDHTPFQRTGQCMHARPPPPTDALLVSTGVAMHASSHPSAPLLFNSYIETSAIVSAS
jgi:hypothetical protein